MIRKLVPAVVAALATVTTAPTLANAVPAGTTFSSGLPAYDEAYAKAIRDIGDDVVDGKFIAGQDWAEVWTQCR